jgi:hypothetical protein
VGIVHTGMKMKNLFSRLLGGAVISAVIVCSGASVSCMTTYDANGYPVQSVDPAVAIAGVAAAGLVGYAIANNNKHYGGGGYYRGGYCPPPPRYCR